MKLAWLTDIHLNFLNPEERELFYAEVRDADADLILISGDIAESNSNSEILLSLASAVKKPILFVLGNHDYYNSCVTDVRESMKELIHRVPNTFYLTHFGPYIPAIPEDLIIVGVDGFADARNGNFEMTPVKMNDSRFIKDLQKANVISSSREMFYLGIPLREKMRELADADAETLKKSIQKAILYNPKKIVVVTHVPPFPEVSYYRGKISGPDFLPFYTSKATGDVLMEMATENPNIQFKVLCGHTHGAADAVLLPNLVAHCGEAHYMNPQIQIIINL